MSEQPRLSFDKVLQDCFRNGQARLPPDRRAAPDGIECCFHEHDGFKCTMAKGHTGQHAAHGMMGHIIREWEGGQP